MTLPGWVGVREPRGRLGGLYAKNDTICPTQACNIPHGGLNIVGPTYTLGIRPSLPTSLYLVYATKKKYNPSLSPSGYPLLSGPPALNEIHAIFTHLPPPVLFLLGAHSFCTRVRSEPCPLAAASALSCALASMREAPMMKSVT